VVLEFLMLTEHLKRTGFVSNGLIYLFVIDGVFIVVFGKD